MRDEGPLTGAGRTGVRSLVTRAQALRLIPWFLALHSLEEGLTIAFVLPLIQARLPDSTARLTAASLTPAGFQVGLVLLTALGFAVALFGHVEVRRSRAAYLLLVLQATLLLNVASHAGTALWLRSYVPGLATALLLNLPFSLYLFRRAWLEEWYSRRALGVLPLVALVVHGPLLMGAIGLLRQLA
jgi:hypothetical protein